MQLVFCFRCFAKLKKIKISLLVFTTIRTDSDNKDFQTLVALLDIDLKIRDGKEHHFYDQFNKITNIKNAVVVYDDNVPVGCGAFKLYKYKTVEIKRMFVMHASRGKGIATMLLQALETWAAQIGYELAILETGKKQPEAIALYIKNGYVITANYGQYKDVENSICMQKNLQ
jgi:putative acetyltransferase